jgi:hypothetical protein
MWCNAPGELDRLGVRTGARPENIREATVLMSAGRPGVIEHVGISKFDEVMTAARTEVLDPQLGIRLTSEHFWITGRKPG